MKSSGMKCVKVRPLMRTRHAFVLAILHKHFVCCITIAKSGVKMTLLVSWMNLQVRTLLTNCHCWMIKYILVINRLINNCRLTAVSSWLCGKLLHSSYSGWHHCINHIHCCWLLVKVSIAMAGCVFIDFFTCWVGNYQWCFQVPKSFSVAVL